MNSLSPRVSRRQTLAGCWAAGLIAALFVAQAESPQPERHGPLRVALVSGSHSPAYLTDQSLAKLKAHLEEHYPMQCALVATNRQDDGFLNIEALEEADTAVFFVRRKTLNASDLAVVRRFFDSGKGFVALRPTSHAWENWPEFDLEVLGAKYEGTFERGNPMDFIYSHPHPIFTGTRPFETRQYMYQYGPPADDVHVILQGRVAAKTTPMAWTRERNGARLFHFVPSHIDDFDDPAYLRIIANGLLWVNRREIPGAETAVVRTIMADADPGSFAVIFPEGPVVCFDPVRGGVNYIVDGIGVDFRPAWTGKVGQAARVRGERFYEETGAQPLRHRDPDAAPKFQFEGYELKNGFPVFKYRIGEHRVREEMRPVPGGTGVVRHFRTDLPGETFWLLTGAQALAVCSAPGGHWNDGRLQVRADDAGEFTVTIRRKEALP